MKHLDLTQFMHDVHQNAIAHGWWEKERSAGTIRSLIHCELSEAMEAYRNHEPYMWHHCPYHPGACETQSPQDDHLHCEACQSANRKPEGVAVELMDFVIRIFDAMANLEGWNIPASMNTAQKLTFWALDDYQDDEGRNPVNLDLPDLVDILHDEVALSSIQRYNIYLLTAAGLAMAWVDKRGIDPVDILMDKHEYNKTRPYKHGGKEC